MQAPTKIAIPLLIPALIVASGILWSSPMHAQKATSGDAWAPAGLSQNTCMQRGQAAMRSAGLQNVRTTSPLDGMGWVDGTLGEYSITVGCITAKDVIVFFGSGPDFAKVTDYLQSIRGSMGG